jgi:hypothetical protein
MGRDRTQQTPDLFSTASSEETSPPATKPVSSAQKRRHILPKDLPNAVKHLNDRELDLLIVASLEEAKRRGRLPPSDQTTKRSSRTDKPSRRQVELATVSLTRGQVNAVRAAFRAGIKPSLIARQFAYPNQMCARCWRLTRLVERVEFPFGLRQRSIRWDPCFRQQLLPA